jgi:hypothetical protein
MRVVTYPIEYKYGQTIRLLPLFDWHRGNQYADMAACRKWLAENDSKDTYYVGGGDLADAIIVEDRRYRKSVDNTRGDAIIDRQVDGLFDMLEPYKKRIIGLGDGNHEDTIIGKGSDITARLCRRLNVERLGFSWLVRLVMRENGGRGRQVVVRGHHGWGGGSRTQGADITKYSKDLQYWEADIFLYGHVHRKQSDRVPRIGLVGNKMISKPKLMAICGTFLKTYSESADSTYSERKGYPPVDVGGLVVNIKPTHKWVKYWIDV